LISAEVSALGCLLINGELVFLQACIPVISHMPIKKQHLGVSLYI
jgi:hypothetical protein